MEEQERPLSELYALVTEYGKMNAVSGRKRGIHILEDIFSMQKNFVTGEYELVLEYGGELTPEAVKKLSQAIPPVRKGAVLRAGGGVLTFFPGSTPRRWTMRCWNGFLRRPAWRVSIPTAWSGPSPSTKSCGRGWC